jgi:hypothetical protein
MRTRLLALTLLLALPAFGQETRTTSCRIVDVIATKAGDQYFVDGVRVPDNGYVIDYLRRAEVASPRSCLRLFVPTSVKIQDVEDMFVIATGKIQYQEFHAYLYDERRDSVSEISLWKTVNTASLRSSNGHLVPWPDLQPKR